MTDNGGPNAIRGFNYQWAVLALVAITNLRKDDLKLIVESEDDIEVLISGTHTFIQVKSGKLGFSRITSLSKNDGGASILAKLIRKGKENDRYKIVTPEDFVSSDKKLLHKCSPGVVFPEYHSLSPLAATKLLNALKVSEDKKELVENKLTRTSFHFTEFAPKMDATIRYLIGLMTENGINVDNSRGINALSRFLTYAQGVAERKVNENKELRLSHIRTIFQTTEIHKCEDDILERLSLPLLTKKKIGIEKTKIPLMYRAEKDTFLNTVQSASIGGRQEDEILADWRVLVGGLSALKEETVDAILIEILAERIIEETGK